MEGESHLRYNTTPLPPLDQNPLFLLHCFSRLSLLFASILRIVQLAAVFFFLQLSHQKKKNLAAVGSFGYYSVG